MQCDTIWKDARLATMIGDGIGAIEHGVIAARDGMIVYAGAQQDAPDLTCDRVIDCKGRWITPGMIDCHTHLVHGGNRALEFEMRLAGASYEEIAKAGGGIVSTMRATRALDEEELVATALPRLDALIAEGVTTVEVKSGYGLDRETEIRMLRAARRLGSERPVGVATTFLGAHALPPEFKDDADGYVAMLCDEVLPEVVALGLADAVDAFCEGIGFNLEQTERMFAAAVRHGLPVKLHAEQLSNLQGTSLAARHGALSADHLEYVDAAGIAAMAASGTVATLLPGAYYFVRETKLPPIEELRAAGVPVALMNMGATLFRLTVDECLAGVTRNAAKALGLSDRGTLAAGKRCDLAIWNIERPAELVYRMGFNPLHARIWSGQ
jgi:imidazolonepropionase